MILAPGMKCTIEDLTSIYADRRVAQAILDSATENKTIERIESGECKLPDPVDAKEYERQLRLTKSFGKTALGKAMSDNPIIHEYLDSLAARLAALESPQASHAEKKGVK